jgi:hypothetical protein
LRVGVRTQRFLRHHWRGRERLVLDQGNSRTERGDDGK